MTTEIIEIPEITHPFGKYWVQPKREDITFSEGKAHLNEEDFNLLHEYSLTNPSGVYAGKMWKRYDGSKWFLCWYSKLDQVHDEITYKINLVEMVVIKQCLIQMNILNHLKKFKI